MTITLWPTVSQAILVSITHNACQMRKGNVMRYENTCYNSKLRYIVRSDKLSIKKLALY